jgi:hypothetical protein
LEKVKNVRREGVERWREKDFRERQGKIFFVFLE